MVKRNYNYQKGRRLEYDVMDLLREKGYYTIRSYASKGIFDVIAVRPQYEPNMDHYPLMIQCKTNGYIPPKEREELKLASERYQGWVVIAYRQNGIKFKALNGEVISHL